MMTTIPFLNLGKTMRAIFAFLAIFVSVMTYAAPREETKSEFSPPPPCGNIVAGSIGGAQSSCGSFDPGLITSVADATSGGYTEEYIWVYKNASTGNSFVTISGATGTTYDPGFITETTTYRRCAQIIGCTGWAGESNDIVMSVNAVGPSVTATSTTAFCADTITVCDMTDYNGSRTIYMPSLGGTSGVSLFTIVNNSAKLYQFSDGTAHYVGKAQKTNDANKQWVFSVWFKDKKDWTAWSAGGGSYKAGPGTAANDHLGWDYYIMDAAKPNKMVGLGDYAGVELDLTHKPSSYLYAMQLGTGANDQDGDYGMSFWFEYTSSSSAYSTGHGDYNADAPTCNDAYTCGGSATAVASGGTGPYAYEWSNGIYGNESKDICIGTYTVTVTDANGCTATASTTISTTVCCDNITAAGSISGAQSSCGSFDPTTIISNAPASGGTGPIEYVWMYKNASTGGVLTAIPGTNSETYDPGNITETTTYRRCARNQGCTSWPGETNDITMTVTTNVTGAGSIGNAQNSCGPFDPSAITSISPATGVGTIEYVWMYKNASTGGVLTAIPGTNSETYDPGNITETTTYRRCARIQGCTSWPGETNDITMTVNPIVTSTVSSTDATGFGVADGSATVVAAGGTPTFTYLWSDGQTTATASSLAAGTYTVTITDTEGCSSSETVVIAEPSNLAVNITVTDEQCSLGDASATVTGGVSPFTYLWSDGQTTSVATGLVAGTYTVTVTDDNGNTATSTGTVGSLVCCSDITPGTIAASQSGCGSFDPAAFTSLSPATTGGSFSIEYIWIKRNVSTGNSWVTIAGANSVTYDASTVSETTDFRRCARLQGCTPYIGESNVITVTINSSPSVTSASINDVSCNGGNDGTVSISVSGGTAPYTYSWDNGATTESISGLTAGLYVVNVTDANGCTTSETKTVNEPTALTSTSTDTDVTCNGDNDGTGSMSVSGGTMPYTYSWDNGATTASISNLAPGTYVGTATDANGCTTVETITITEPTV
ncbi:MAG: SprB repeat-containing protein, partial [Crocinitomicaceae bacterium]